MQKITLLFIMALTVAFLAGPALARPTAPGLSAFESQRLLQEGNTRYTEGRMRHPHQGRERRALNSAQGQHPLAAILACSDSRVPPEIIFDQGLGDIFVVRVAGNVAATDEIGSIEYAVDRLNTPLVVVLGHTQCGTVDAVLEGAKLPPNFIALEEPIKIAVAKAQADHPGAAKDVLLNAAITDNVWQAIADMLEHSPSLREKVKADQVKVVGAVYDIDTGKVQWLGPHPEQASLIAIKKGTSRKSKKARDFRE
jgi:carbonic anhydrase